MNKRLKKYRLKINPKNGAVVDFISQVENPAIQVGFLKFNETIKTHFSDDKMEIFGPVLIPDMPIYRNSEKMGEYEVYFTVEDIKEIQMNFFKSGFQNNVNLDHSDKMAKSFVFESFMSSELVPNPEPFKEYPLGVWYVRMKVEDKNVWDDIKSGKRKGFSIEGIFEYIMTEFEESFEKPAEPTTIYVETHQKNNLEIMLKNLFRKVFAELSQELEDKPSETPDETLEYQKVESANYKISVKEIGQKVEVVNADGQLEDAPDGSYEFEDGFKFTVKDGLLTEINGNTDAPVEEVPVETADVPVEDAPVEVPVEEGPSDMDVLKEKVDELTKELESIKQAISSFSTEESMKESMNEIKDYFKNIFEKFAEVPAEPSKVIKNNVAKDNERRKFELFIASLKK